MKGRKTRISRFGDASADWFNTLSEDDGSAEVINKALAWAMAIAADDSHGYDQANRDGPDYAAQAWFAGRITLQG